MSQFQQLRVVHPVSVNETVVHTYNFRLEGAPARMFENTISFANIVNGTGSLVLTDDLEIYNRIGLGLSSAGPEWLEIGRGYQGDVRDEHGGRRGKNSTSEIYIRNMFDAWLGYMARDEQPTRRHAASASACAEMRQMIAVHSSGPRSSNAHAGKSLTVAECEQFLVHEARLLDEGRFDEWLSLFTPDAWYWVPAQPIRRLRATPFP